MNKLSKTLSLFVVFLFASSITCSEEGMWQPSQLRELGGQLTDMGLELRPDNIDSLDAYPLNAVVSLGGCSASFVSPQGLVVTNHHCVYGSVQYNSSESNNLLDDGFLAKSLDEELPAAPGSRVYVTQSVQEVTRKVLDGVTDEMDGLTRYQVIESAVKQLIKDCENSGIHRCSVPPFHHGVQYFLVKRLEIRDVRLVYAPATSIGKYGGDIDNWQWPRHTGDFGFYRAYVGKDGKPADYSTDNIPYRPIGFLSIASQGLDSGSFVMAAGYPGTTNRYRTSSEIQNQFEWYYPRARQLREQLIDIIQSNTEAGTQARIAYESTLASLSNYAKNFQSMGESYHRSDFLQRRQELEKDFIEWMQSSPERKNNLLPAVTELNSLINRQQSTQARDLILGYMAYATMPGVAQQLYRLAFEKQKPDELREPGYQERDEQRLAQSMQSVTRRYNREVDKAIFLFILDQYLKLPEEERMSSIDHFFGFDNEAVIDKKFFRVIDKMYETTRLESEETRLSWMDKTMKELRSSADPMLIFGIVAAEAMLEIEKIEKNIDGEKQKWRPQYMQALIDFNRSKGKPIYADANGTLRVTYGRVFGNQPKDGLRNLTFTTLEGIVEKDTGIEPFNSPQEQLELISSKQYGDYELSSLRSVPVNFLSTLDITGGNSGSAVMNGRGQLVGLLFDGVYESIIGDWDFNENLNRAIAVDIRYMLWVMKYVDGADNVLSEMAILNETPGE